MTTYADKVIAGAPLEYFRLNSSSALVTNEVTVNTGTSFGGVVARNPKVWNIEDGASFRFNGTTAYVAAMGAAGHHRIEFWICLFSAPSATNLAVQAGSYSGGAGGANRVSIRADLGVEYKVAIDLGGGNYDVKITNTVANALTLGKWHLIQVETFDGPDQCSIKVDGVTLELQTHAPFVLPASPSTNVFIGGSGAAGVNALIAEVVIGGTNLSTPDDARVVEESPQIIDVVWSDVDKIIVHFNEAIDASDLEDETKYTISGGVSVTSANAVAENSDGSMRDQRVTLTLTGLSVNGSYLLTVDDSVADALGQQVVAGVGDTYPIVFGFSSASFDSESAGGFSEEVLSSVGLVAGSNEISTLIGELEVNLTSTEASLESNSLSCILGELDIHYAGSFNSSNEVCALLGELELSYLANMQEVECVSAEELEPLNLDVSGSATVVYDCVCPEEEIPPVNQKPYVTNYVPPEGTPIRRTDMLQFDVLDAEGALRQVAVFVEFEKTQDYEVIYDGEKFGGKYKNNSTKTNLPLGLRFNVLRKGGWPSQPTIRVAAVDQGGEDAVEP